MSGPVRATTLRDLHRRAGRLGIHGEELAELLHDLEERAEAGEGRALLELRARSQGLPLLLAGIATELVLQELGR